MHHQAVHRAQCCCGPPSIDPSKELRQHVIDEGYADKYGDLALESLGDALGANDDESEWRARACQDASTRVIVGLFEDNCVEASPSNLDQFYRS